jgi:hypothetical protein
MLDTESWKLALKVYAGKPIPALALAFQLAALKQSLQRGQKGIPDAIEGLDVAIQALYEHTSFHKMGHKLFRQRLEGTLKPKQEEKLRELGVRF